jgi:signal transduction histidine kinase
MSPKDRQPDSRAVDLQEALSEKVYTAERAISGLRLAVIAANTVLFSLILDKGRSHEGIAYAVIALSWLYGLYIYRFEPYRRHAVFLSAYFTSITDAAFIMLWLFATGGFYSPFYLLLYPAMVSVAFRFTARETIFAAVVYAGAYLGLLLGLNQLAGHGQEVLVRLTYTFLMALLGHLISREVLEQTKSKISYKEHVKAIEAAEVKFRALAETANDAIISAGSDGVIIYCNPSARRMFGYSAQQMVGSSLNALLGQSGVAGRTVEVVAQRRDGAPFPAELSLASWKLGDADYCTAIVRDVSERKKSEQTALELVREQTLRAGAEESKQNWALLAEASRILGGSLEHESALRDLAHLIVPTVSDGCVIHLQSEDEGLRKVAQSTSDGKAGALGALSPVDRADGAELSNGRSSLVVPIGEQEPSGTITFLMGDSNRQFKPADVSICEELGRRAAVAVEHSRLFKEAQDAIRARDDFLSIASHELNTPLTALQLQMELLLEQARAEGSQTVRRVDILRRQVLRLSNLIANLLDLSRISAGKLALNFEEVDLSQVVREAAERSEEPRKRAGSPLALSAAMPVIGVWDRMRIEQVVSNLLTNAIKYGEGRPIEIGVDGDGEVARLTIRDHGMGIPSKDRATLFARFSRGSYVQRHGGFGLGLWIAHQVVTALGGTIQVDSEPGQGSIFTVELPLARASQVRAASMAARAS